MSFMRRSCSRFTPFAPTLRTTFRKVPQCGNLLSTGGSNSERAFLTSSTTTTSRQPQLSALNRSTSLLRSSTKNESVIQRYLSTTKASIVAPVAAVTCTVRMSTLLELLDAEEDDDGC